MFLGEEGTGRVDGALIAFWVAAFAKALAVPFHKQVCARAGVEIRRDIRFDLLRCFAICHTIVLALLPPLNAHEPMRAIRLGGTGAMPPNI